MPTKTKLIYATKSPFPRPALTKTAEKADPEQVRAVLNIVLGVLDGLVGEDEAPAAFWAAIEALPGVDADAMELAQDSTLLGRDVIRLVRDNFENPQALASQMLLLVLGAVPEIVEDVKNVRG